MSKVKIEFELDFCEDYEEAEKIIKYREIYADVYKAYYAARNRLKYSNTSDEESVVLENIMCLLGGYIE